MKTHLITLLALAAGTWLAPAQATINIGNNSAAYLIETNASVGYVPGLSVPTTGLATARTVATLNSFFYEVLTTHLGANTAGTAPTLVPSANPFDPLWLDTGVGGKNSPLTRGGIISVGGPATLPGTWAEPTGPLYVDGKVQWYLIVGWSANLGNNWASAAAAAQNPGALAPGANYFFGQSPLAYQVGGAGPAALPWVVLWGNGTGIPGAGLSSGFTLVQVVPEPSAFALGTFGVTLLVSRRKKK